MKTLVVVPTYNEAATINTVIQKVDHLGYEILVVDDGSPDATADIVDDASRRANGVHLLRRRSKAGLGSAYRAGFRWALKQNRYDVVCQMDADLSHDPVDLARLVDAVQDGADVAIGSRYVAGGSTTGWPLSRQWLSRGGDAYMRLVTGIGVRDMTAGFRAWRTDSIRDLALCSTESEGYTFQLETTSLAWRNSKHVTEVPIVFTERAEGESKMNWRIIMEALWRVVIMGWRVRRPEAITRRTPANRRATDLHVDPNGAATRRPLPAPSQDAADRRAS
jgi:dolichol-phosphate mannosyltransferase